MNKICILTTVHPPFDARIFHKEAKTLVNAGCDVTLITQHDEEEIVDGIKIIPLPKPKNRFYRILFLTRKAYKLALEQKADIYHFHDPEFLPWAIKLKKKTGAKIIYDVHEDIPKQILSKHWIPKIFRNLISILFNYYEKRASSRFNYIITTTPDIKNKFKHHNVVDIKNFPKIERIKERIFQKIKKEKNKYIFIYTGGLERMRGTKEIIEATTLINQKYNTTLKLLGSFSEKKFETEMKNLNGWGKVEFLGQVSVEEVYRELVGADIGLVCLHPLKRFTTSLPVKMFEYMAAGIPVVASNFPLWKEIIEGNNCGICVNPLDPKEIAEAIEYLIEHPDEAKKMGENGRKAVLEKYNWENESKKLLEVYEKLMA